MKGILADANIEGYVDRLVAQMCLDPWKIFWVHLQISYVRFVDLGLLPNARDSLIWQTCQDQQLTLITDNRNAVGTDSLQATIQSHNTPNCLPVFTIGEIQRLNRDAVYVERVIENLFVYLLNIDSIRGTGRLFLP